MPILSSEQHQQVDAQGKAWGWGCSRVPNIKPLPSPHLRLSFPSSPYLWAELHRSLEKGLLALSHLGMCITDTCSDGLGCPFSFSPHGPQASRATRSMATGCCLSGCMVWPQPVRTPAKHCSRASWPLAGGTWLVRVSSAQGNTGPQSQSYMAHPGV